MKRNQQWKVVSNGVPDIEFGFSFHFSGKSASASGWNHVWCRKCKEMLPCKKVLVNNIPRLVFHLTLIATQGRRRVRLRMESTRPTPHWRSLTLKTLSSCLIGWVENLTDSVIVQSQISLQSPQLLITTGTWPNTNNLHYACPNSQPDLLWLKTVSVIAND